MKTTILIVFILITRITFAQNFSEFGKILQIADSIWTNVRFHGPHYDGREESLTYYRIDENNYIKTKDFYDNDKIKTSISWYIFQGEPIVYHKRQIKNSKIYFEIIYFISNRKVIGLQLECVGDFNSEKILEIEKSVKKELLKKDWICRDG